MFVLRTACTAIISSRNAVVTPNLQSQSNYTSSKRFYTSEEKDYKSMVDPKRVVSYDDVLKVIHQPQKVIIDVREPEEVQCTGKIPSSINIPLDAVHDALVCMSHEDFRRQFQREKPSCSDELIFYCKTGRRSSEALDKALKLGYSNSKTYLGSWTDWSSRRNL